MFNSKLINIGDFIVIGIMAYLFIWLANRAIKALGMPQYTTTATLAA